MRNCDRRGGMTAAPLAAQARMSAAHDHHPRQLPARFVRRTVPGGAVARFAHRMRPCSLAQRLLRALLQE